MLKVTFTPLFELSYKHNQLILIHHCSGLKLSAAEKSLYTWQTLVYTQVFTPVYPHVWCCIH